MPKVGSKTVWVILSCASPFRSSILVGGSMPLFLAYARVIKGKSYKVETLKSDKSLYTAWSGNLIKPKFFLWCLGLRCRHK